MSETWKQFSDRIVSGSEDLSEPLPESKWFAVTSFGRRLAFTLAPHADEEFAAKYAARNMTAVLSYNVVERTEETVVSVERA